ALRATAPRLGLVPTMGALHAGHGALVAASVAGGAATIASIFVNPLQFGPTEDLTRYPRDEAGDLAKLQAWGCGLVWLPGVETMYPADGATAIVPAGPAEGWEGAARPGHFRGVATVVAKLFGQVGAETAYFGEKDWQQLQVVRRMVADLHLPVAVIGVPTVREPDGLALSSRNRYLTTAERAHAPTLHRALSRAATTLAGGAAAASVLTTERAALERDGFAVDYLALVDGMSLRAIDAVRPGARLIVAARLGAVRLIDNIASG
ncbi:MAG: pantoate--beta-alanine ligase, partial [Rhodospirillales bacterium]|nr:pantoate--beta-alanine ligase [Rhodospirillales bacterium]